MLSANMKDHLQDWASKNFSKRMYPLYEAMVTQNNDNDMMES